MTGFGAASAETGGSRYAVEIRAVNGKFYKSAVRLPEELLPLEPELDQWVSRRLGRGSVTISVRFAAPPGLGAARVDGAVVAAYLEQIARSIPAHLREQCRIDPVSVLSLPGAMAAESGDALLADARAALAPLVEEACDRVIEMRRREGAALAAHLRQLGGDLAERLGAIALRAPQVVAQYRERLRGRIDALLAEVGGAMRDEDLLREVAIYADRSDIAEEVERLEGHLVQLEQVLSPVDGQPAGRVLDFLAQEMLREANTIASKSSDAEISRLVVEVKGLIDRIKEQAANVE
jgi:uncharacterized protein (TIGR00255 family)